MSNGIKNEVIATRFTYDGKKVHLFSDGSVTWSFGYYVKGSPRTKDSKALEAGWLFMGDVELYNADEASRLIDSAKWSVRKNKGIQGMRDYFSRYRKIKLKFTVISADNRGKAVSSVCKLPRLFWNGLAVFKDGSRYSVWSEIGRTGTYEPTGFNFKNMTELWGYLESNRISH